MDKRWIYILIIFIIGVVCLFYIVDSSNTVGRANVNVNTFTLTLPPDYNIDAKKDKYVVIVNKDTRERISIKDLGKISIAGEMKNKTSILEQNENVTLIKNMTTDKNLTTPSIYYERIPDSINRVTYFTKYNHTFAIECHYFHENSTIEKDTLFLMENLRPDYKQKQS